MAESGTSSQPRKSKQRSSRGKQQQKKRDNGNNGSQRNQRNNNAPTPPKAEEFEPVEGETGGKLLKLWELQAMSVPDLMDMAEEFGLRELGAMQKHVLMVSMVFQLVLEQVQEL